jgi:hypothetical protein
MLVTVGFETFNLQRYQPMRRTFLIDQRVDRLQIILRRFGWLSLEILVTLGAILFAKISQKTSDYPAKKSDSNPL